VAVKFQNCLAPVVGLAKKWFNEFGRPSYPIGGSNGARSVRNGYDLAHNKNVAILARTAAAKCKSDGFAAVSGQEMSSQVIVLGVGEAKRIVGHDRYLANSRVSQS
jgi:hypothetical protein